MRFNTIFDHLVVAYFLGHPVCRQCATSGYTSNWSLWEHIRCSFIQRGSCCGPLSIYRPYVYNFKHKPILDLKW